MSSYFSSQHSQSAASQRRGSLPRLGSDDSDRSYQPVHILPSVAATTTTGAAPRENHVNSNLILQQQIFAEKSNRLLNLLQNTSGLLGEIVETNATRPWQIQIPSTIASSVASSSNNNLRRSNSFSSDEDLSRSLPLHQRIQRSFTTSSTPSSPPPSHTPTETPSNRLFELNVLKLDLKVGNYGAGNDTLLRGLERNSIAHLFDGRIQQSIKHLDNLYQRVSDKSSKVLITGDLNAGKSTLVNALMQRTILPVDQQPCTSLFCEVLDAQENEGQEAVHAIKEPTKYNREDPNTFTVVDMRHLEKFMNDVIDGYEDYAQLKVDCTDRRLVNDSLLHNGVVDIALIDSPGLNRDSVKTTALFARQQEIDVVVFVVSAENHFTLSVSNNFF
jgi:mitofusin